MKLFIRTFGCQMNEYDSDRMTDLLRAALNVEVVDRPEEADILLLNTCSVREKAQEKVFHELGRFRPLKQANPTLIIGVGGCVASQEGKAILSRAPFVDIIFGPQTLHRLPQMIEERLRTGRTQVDVSFPEMEKFDTLPSSRQEGVSAFVSIMEGCSRFCTYCIVPFTRGNEVSRPFIDVMNEVTALAARGVKEVTLLGQNVNNYRDKTGVDLADMIEAVAAIPRIERLRYMTSHPRRMTQRLFDVYARVPKLVSHLHLPVQAGSDRILAAMKRGYTALEYKSVVRKLRAVRPDISISSDFIVGFPGETEDDFGKTMTLIEEVGFDASFSFLFSPRPGTPAADMPDDTPPALKSERLKQLQGAIEAQSFAISEGMVGRCERVLVEGTAKKNAEELSGRTDNNRVVNFAGAKRLIGHVVEVHITAALPHSLRGEVRGRE
ncbi:MAG: tRNA (N6-isopentenyl adenosine(37)-C2)-methylthiotransferase MiaB [Rhodocyclaceae bacterium]|nr:tRNA (N6-isopentenyl adenosine(37)-C2)-methylthiotransferase MiaB [Rhodocyclaceae bacterium]